MKKSKKFLAVLSTTAMMASLPAAAAIPFAANVAQAAAAGSLSALFVPTISNSVPSTSLGTIDIFVPKGSISKVTSDKPYTVTFTLPSGFQFDTTAKSTYSVAYGVYQPDGSIKYYDAVDNSQDYGTGDAPNEIYVGGDQAKSVFVTAQTLSNSSVQINVYGDQTDDVHIYVKLGRVQLTGPNNGPVNITFAAPSDSVLPSGTVTVANVQSSGMVDLVASDTQSSSDNFTFNLRLTEEVVNSLQRNGTIKLKLPNGFKWDDNKFDGTSATPPLKITKVFGDAYDTSGRNLNITSDRGDDTLTITAKGDPSNASSYLIQNLRFYVDDENAAQTGDVVVQVQGTDTTNVSSLVVGNYGQYGGTVQVLSTPTIVAGQKEQKIGDIAIKEAVAKSFVNNRTITLTLPDGARWESDFEGKDNDLTGTVSYNNDVSGVDYSYTGTDKRTLKLTLKVNSGNFTNPAEIDLKNFQVAVRPDFTGDLTVDIGGSQGLTGSAVVAKVQSPVSVSVASKPNVIIGSAGQQIGDITLTENVAGAFSKTTYNTDTYNLVHLELPYGVQFDGTPDVEVTSGDLKIKDVSSGLGSDNKGYLNFYVDSASTTPSTITIKSPKLKLDRTVPQGDITLKVKGSAVSFTAFAKNGPDYAVQSWYDNNTTAASAAIATVATPAPGETTGSATFTIGSTSYTVNGQSMTADVAPYIKNGRTYLPVTYVAQALGVSLQNIVWNNADRSVTIFNGSRVVKMVVGSNTLVVNGVSYSMDTAPEIQNSRTMLPVAYLATALGINYSWDATTQTVTFGK